MEYKECYVYKLMDNGGPTDVREPYFKEAVDEMMRARVLCAKANALLPDDSTYVSYLEELFEIKLETCRILTPFICDFGNRVKFGICTYSYDREKTIKTRLYKFSFKWRT